MTKETHAYLPASRVLAACEKLCSAIYGGRQKIAKKIAAQNGEAALSPELAKIPTMYRDKEERAVRTVLDLAQAVVDYDPSHCVYVSARHFQLLRPYYAEAA